MSGIAKSIKTIPMRPTPYEDPLLDDFDLFVSGCSDLADWTLLPNRAPWQNYAASYGIAAVNACYSISALLRSGNIQGVATVTREVYEIVTRFVFCLRHKDAAVVAILRGELDQIRRIGNAQVTGVPPLTESASALKEHCNRQIASVIAGSPPNAEELEEEPRTGDNISPRCREAYTWLCLGAHNRPHTVVTRYNHHFDHDELVATQRECLVRIRQYVWLASIAMHEGLSIYLASDAFPAEERAPYLSAIDSLVAPILRDSPFPVWPAGNLAAD